MLISLFILNVVVFLIQQINVTIDVINFVNLNMNVMNITNLTQNQFNYLCENACVDCGIALENDNIVATLKLTNVSVSEKMELITNILNTEF